MPELPDILAYIAALEPRVVGKRLEAVRLCSPFLLRSIAPPLSKLEGRRVVGLSRMGKRIVFALEGDMYLVLHLMVAGRLHWKKPGAKVGGRGALAAFDFEDGSLVLSEASTKKRASIQLVRGEGLLLAVELRAERAPDVVRLGLEEGVLLNATGPTTIRLAPPLTLNQAEAQEALEKFKRALDHLGAPEVTQPAAG